MNLASSAQIAPVQQPVLTVAALNDIFRSKENIDVWEMPKSLNTEVLEDDGADDGPHGAF